MEVWTPVNRKEFLKEETFSNGMQIAKSQFDAARKLEKTESLNQGSHDSKSMNGHQIYRYTSAVLFV